MKWWGWALALLPAGAGVIFYWIATNTGDLNPVLYLRGSLAAVVIRLGVTLSVLAVAFGLLWAHHQRTLRDLQHKANDDRRRFLQRLDHELKNPLTAIQAGLTNMTYEPLEGYLAEETAAVQSQVGRISRLVADLRKLAALEDTPLEATTVNVAELLTDVISALEGQGKTVDRNLSLIIPNAPWPLPEVKGDPDLLLLAVHNLLDNAIKFTSPGDTIEVRAFDDGSEIVIEVADTGPGIPDQETERVWEELYRGDGARGVPGSGLGLPLVRAIVEKHGGNVRLRSRPEQGTVFSVHLPAL